jgi:hypothetical protein
MVESPDRLRIICFRKFSSLLKSDQLIWKKQIEEYVDKFYREEKTHSTINDQQKRKHHRGESFRTDEELTTHSMNYSHHQTLFIEYFLQGFCPLNSILSEHLANYLVTHDQLNDFTLSLFSSNVTCLKRFVINVKYLSRLQCHILNQHPNIIELEIIFKDSNSNRTVNMINEIFYQHICPSIDSKFDDIYAIYSPFILHHKYSLSQIEPRRSSVSNTSSLQRLPYSSDEFTHHKLLSGIFNNLNPVTSERLKILSLSHYKFFAASHTTAARKYSQSDMSPSSKW